MNVALISPNLPSPTGAGVAMVNWAIVNELKSRGHRVRVYYPTDEPIDSTNPPVDLVTLLRHQEVDLICFSPTTTPEKFAEMVSRHNPPADVFFCYTVGTLRITAKINIPKVCALVDLDHLVSLFRRQYDNRNEPISYTQLTQYHRVAQKIKDTTIPELKSCAAVIEHADHHNQWLRSQYVDSQYIPMPVVDPYFPGWNKTYKENGNKKVQIIMAGHLTGIATLSGLYYLAEALLPLMDPDLYDLHIFGADKLLPDLADRFRPYSWVKFEGYIQDIQREILAADIFLVPTPISLGFRTRIVEGWALGSCVIAHSANIIGMPEARNNENILVADEPRVIVEMIKIAAENVDLRRGIGEHARINYEQFYMGSESKVVDIIEGVTGSNDEATTFKERSSGPSPVSLIDFQPVRGKGIGEVFADQDYKG